MKKIDSYQTSNGFPWFAGLFGPLVASSFSPPSLLLAEPSAPLVRQSPWSIGRVLRPVSSWARSNA